MAGHLSRKGLKCIMGDKSTVIQRVHQRAVNVITDDLEWDESLDLESIRIFLESPEVEEIVRQMYSVAFLEEDHNSMMLIRDEYLNLSSFLLESESDDIAGSANAIFDLLIRICDLVLKAGIEEGMLPAHEAMSNLRYNVTIQATIVI